MKCYKRRWARSIGKATKATRKLPILVHILDDNGNSPFEIP